MIIGGWERGAYAPFPFHNVRLFRVPTQVLKVLKRSYIDFHKFKALKRS